MLRIAIFALILAIVQAQSIRTADLPGILNPLQAGSIEVASYPLVNMPKPNPCPWTPWFDRDDPSVTGDYEGLADLIKEGNDICAKPVAI